MMKHFLLTLALLVFVFSMTAERGKGFLLSIALSCGINYDHECFTRDGRCMEPNSTWQDGCVFYKCAQMGLKIYRPQMYFNGCMDHKGECRNISSRWTDHSCTKYQCQLENNLTTSHVLSEGCYHRDNCREVNSTWIVNCKTYQCRKRRNGLRVRRISGKCVDDNGGCRSNGERFTWKGDNCTCTVLSSRKYATRMYCP